MMRAIKGPIPLLHNECLSKINKKSYRFGESEYIEKVVIAQRVHNGLDEFLGDLQSHSSHGAARVQQN